MTTEVLERPAGDAVTTPDELLQLLADAQPAPLPERDAGGDVKAKELIIISWSGSFDKVMPTLILASTAAASGVKCKVFMTFWGLLPLVKNQKRIVGGNWMQKMLSFMQRPGIDHVKLSQMNFMGMGPWMMGKLSKKYNVASPAELLEACMALGVEFMPCQMTMDMFGLKREDMIDGLGEPVGAATVIELMTHAQASLFI